MIENTKREHRMKILFATSEAHPLIKTGGLADVSGSLPTTLHTMGADIRLVLPAYPQAIARLGEHTVRARLSLPVVPTPVSILEGKLPGSDVTVWLIDSPLHFSREGGPYTTASGHDWPDNAQRFALFARCVVELAMDRGGLGWRPDVVHCNDWQTGLIPALLVREKKRPATIFTIHNLAYQGVFSWDTFASLGLPHELWHMEAMEFYGNFSYIKGGLAFADHITTVSPTYAREIRTAAFGYGLEGLLNHRADRLSGILNGVDYAIWDPAGDPLIPATYSPACMEGKSLNKEALQHRFGLSVSSDTPLFGLVGRLVEQKGIDLVIEALPVLLREGMQVVVLGSGTHHFEQRLRDLASHYPRQLGVHIGYDEALAHLVEAGSDIFLMPSRFEPCGLNQIYSLRYGTLPLVRRTGGLADTVVDTAPTTLATGKATGFVFDDATPEALLSAAHRAIEYYHYPAVWQQLMEHAMAQEYSWDASARHYLTLYQQEITTLSGGSMTRG